MFAIRRVGFVACATIMLTSCMTTSMQGYANRNLPSKPVNRLVAHIAAPTALASHIQSSITEEGRKRGVITEDALVVFPPTRTCTNAEIRQGLGSNGIDGVLVLNVGDSGANLWIENGQVTAGGLLFVGDGANASSSVAAIFDDLQQKELLDDRARLVSGRGKNV